MLKGPHQGISDAEKWLQWPVVDSTRTGRSSTRTAQGECIAKRTNRTQYVPNVPSTNMKIEYRSREKCLMQPKCKASARPESWLSPLSLGCRLCGQIASAEGNKPNCHWLTPFARLSLCALHLQFANWKKDSAQSILLCNGNVNRLLFLTKSLALNIHSSR